jgi:hypothetical protein
LQDYVNILRSLLDEETDMLYACDVGLPDIRYLAAEDIPKSIREVLHCEKTVRGTMLRIRTSAEVILSGLGYTYGSFLDEDGQWLPGQEMFASRGTYRDETEAEGSLFRREMLQGSNEHHSSDGNASAPDDNALDAEDNPQTDRKDSLRSLHQEYFHQHRIFTNLVLAAAELYVRHTCNEILRRLPLELQVIIFNEMIDQAPEIETKYGSRLDIISKHPELSDIKGWKWFAGTEHSWLHWACSDNTLMGDEFQSRLWERIEVRFYGIPIAIVRGG